jgi:hypothetical protein|uniref:Glutaredoxin domain-containing protein n=1 Tax=viral metagenome TaxID=1070528 RepID=A0A6C0IZS8_9ZZZZ
MITLFIMKGCGYCHKAMEMLHDHIKTEMITIKDISEAPSHVNAAPFFKAHHNGKEYMGLPESTEHLLDMLEISKENLHHGSEHKVSGCGYQPKQNVKEEFRFGPTLAGESTWANKCTGYSTLGQLPKWHPN